MLVTWMGIDLLSAKHFIATIVVTAALQVCFTNGMPFMYFLTPVSVDDA